MACEISTADELLLTEMLFAGVFNDLSVEQGVALLSCFVFNEEVRARGLRVGPYTAALTAAPHPGAVRDAAA